MQVGLLGPLRVVGDDGVEVRVAAPKERAVLELLALRAGRVAPAGELIDAVWGEDPPRSASKTLQTYVSSLRRFLPAGRIETVGGGYRLVVSADAVDALCFEELVRQGGRALQEGDLSGAVEAWREGLRLWRGEPLAELAGQPTGMAEAVRLGELRRDCEEQLAEARLALGEHGSLVADLEAAVAAQPLRERRWAQLMLALYRSGRQADALRAYQRLRTVLGDQLGIEPNTELRALEQGILNQDRSLQFSADTAAPVVGTAGSSGASGLPSGNVTFVFTDVEGSTALFRRLGGRFPPLLEEQRRLIRAAVSAHGGAEVNTAGDGLFLAFADAAHAVAACVDAQRTLAAYPWPADAQLRVRMGVHTGVAAPTAERDYIAVAVHLAARLAGAGHGGQILMSSQTALLRPLLRASSLVDRGAFLLRGFEEAEHIFQLVHPDLPSSFPPLLASPAIAHNLPDVRTSFIGRDDDLKLVDELLRAGRLVTIVGPGGAGKTRLAIEVAARSAAEFDGRVRLADLSRITDPASVPDTIVGAFDIRSTPGADPLDVLARTLAGLNAVLIVDNCEHMLNAVAASVEILISATTGLRVMATSRERLSVAGEQVWRVPTLTIPDLDAGLNTVRDSAAVRLFEDRARLVEPDFTVTANNVEDVVAICREVDGLPLAIELAAARTGAMHVSDMAARLSGPTALLKLVRGRPSGRHGSLEAVIDWSFQLLDESERRALRRLSVFASGFTLEAAEAVIDAADPVDTLTSLADKSLVVRDPLGGRYRLLDTIRRYAADRLDGTGETAAARASHASYYWGLARQAESALAGPKQGSWQDRLSLDHNNLRLALTYLRDNGAYDRTLEMLTALGRYWLIRANRVEAVAAFEAALDQADRKVPRALLGRALATAAAVAGPVDLHASWRWIQAAVEIAWATNDDALAADALGKLAMASYFRGQPDRTSATESLAAARRVGDSVLIGLALYSCGVAWIESDSSQAIRYFREGISATTASGDLSVRGLVTGALGIIYFKTGELGLAHTMCEAAIRCSEELGSHDPIDHANFAEILMTEGDLRAGYDRMMIALRMPQPAPYQTAVVVGTAAHYALCINALETAAVLYGVYDEMMLQIGRSPEVPQTVRTDVSILGARLGESYSRHHDRGRTLNWEEALALITALGSGTSG